MIGHGNHGATVANLIRRMYRKLLDTELGGVGDELTQAQDQLDALTERFHRLQARVSMKDLRKERAARGETDDGLVDELKLALQKKGNGAKSEWPELE